MNTNQNQPDETVAMAANEKDDQVEQAFGLAEEISKRGQQIVQLEEMVRGFTREINKVEIQKQKLERDLAAISVERNRYCSAFMALLDVYTKRVVEAGGRVMVETVEPEQYKPRG